MTTERTTQDEWRASETENGGFYAPGGHYWIAGPGNFHAQGKAASEKQEKVRDKILAMREALTSALAYCEFMQRHAVSNNTGTEPRPPIDQIRKALKP